MSADEYTQHAIVAFSESGEPCVMDMQSNYLREWVLDHLSWDEMNTDIINEVGAPPSRIGVWVVRFNVGGGRDYWNSEYDAWPIGVTWSRPNAEEIEAITTDHLIEDTT